MSLVFPRLPCFNLTVGGFARLESQISLHKGRILSIISKAQPFAGSKDSTKQVSNCPISLLLPFGKVSCCSSLFLFFYFKFFSEKRKKRRKKDDFYHSYFRDFPHE